MSKTFLIDGNLVNLPGSTMAHAMAEASERAHAAGVTSGEIAKPFYFDLINFVKEIKTEQLKLKAIDRLKFTVDNRIQLALSMLLNDYYQGSKEAEGGPTYATYNSFIEYIEGLEYSEQSLYEMGFDVKPRIDNVRNLIAFRLEIHSLSAGMLRDPSSYVMPDLAEKLANPAPRKVSVAEELGLRDIAEDDAEGDEELLAELLDQYKHDQKVKHLNQHRMDQLKAKSLVVLLSCIKASGAEHPSENDDAFFDMLPREQLQFLRGTLASIIVARADAVTSNKLTVPEKGALRKDAKALMATLTETMQHPIFAD